MSPVGGGLILAPDKVKALYPLALDTLEKDGLVERLADPSDRRTKQLRLTAEGEKVLEEIFAIADEMRGRLLGGLPEDKLDEVNDFLGLLNDRLDAGLPPRAGND